CRAASAGPAASRDSIPTERGAATVSARLPYYAAAASSRAMGGRHLPLASRILRADCKTHGCAVAALSANDPSGNSQKNPWAARLHLSYDDGPQGGIVARLEVRSEVFIRPSALPSSSMSTLHQAPDWPRILTLAFRGTLLPDLQFWLAVK